MRPHVFPTIHIWAITFTDLIARTVELLLHLKVVHCKMSTAVVWILETFII